jgi:anaerobic glycerol-3-phosphate dehydrogenase
VVDNITEEISLLQAFADILPADVLAVAKSVADSVPHPQQLRDNPDKRREVNIQTAGLLDSINAMLED